VPSISSKINEEVFSLEETSETTQPSSLTSSLFSNSKEKSCDKEKKIALNRIMKVILLIRV
jgi:hypothetical protein